MEVEAVIKKLQQLHLMAIIGPSGAGKTSFLQAGLIPALPQNWGCIVCQPGDSPKMNLAHALVDEFSGDKDATHKMLQFEEIDVALSLLHQWRNKHSDVLLIVDRFEELFTLNTHETQSRFAELLGRAVLESNLRILLIMRDDFLVRCQEYRSLIPILSELTIMLPLSGVSLRSALIQPAQRCGYRFEDDALIEEILADVEKERGALPLMSFAALRLWEKRDRQSGTLTRKAYNEIGRIAGALAQHAESTMDRIGSDKHAIVREIFRNLTTAQNTRAVRDTEDLLSVFSNRKDAESALRTLVDARLLISYEVKEEGKSRVEIIHESLLSAWPRLVRWQTQDADSAQLRDQLRQAAQLWEQRGRVEDLLWTGAAFAEYQLWRERYVGGLSSTEEAFAHAMMLRAMKSRRQKRIAVATIFIVLLTTLGVISKFWRSEKLARKQAVSEAQRAEASKLLTLGQSNEESYPTAALAYAIKSLELTDTLEGRMFALKIIQHSPPATIIPSDDPKFQEFMQRVDFSPDGRWIAIGGYLQAQVRSRDGNGPILITKYSQTGSHCWVQFGCNSDRLFTDVFGDIRFFSIPEKRELGRWNLFSPGVSQMFRAGKGLLFSTEDATKRTIYFSPDQDTEPKKLGEIPIGSMQFTNSTLLFTDAERRKVYERSLNDWNLPPRMVLQQSEEILDLSIHPSGKQFALIDESGLIAIRSLNSVSSQTLRIMRTPGLYGVRYDPGGNRLVALGRQEDRATLHFWDLTAPSGSAPIVLSRNDSPYLNHWTFHPSGDWFATTSAFDVALWPVAKSSATTLTGHGYGSPMDVAFAADGKQLFSVSDDGTVRRWPLLNASGEEPQIVLAHTFVSFPRIAIDDHRGRFAVPVKGGRVLVANFDGSNIRILKGYSPNAWLMPVAFSPDGRLVATGPYSGPKKDKVLRVWNLDSGEMSVLGPLPGAGEGFQGSVIDLKFVDEKRVVVSLYGSGILIYDVPTNQSHVISNKKHGNVSITANKRSIISQECKDQGTSSSRQYCGGALVRINLWNNETTVLDSHGDFGPVALDPTGRILVTKSITDGLIQVRNLSGGDPHPFFGFKEFHTSVAVSPDGHWIASGGSSGKIVLIPMPDLSKPAPQTLPYDLFLAKLKSFTNLRVVADSNSSTGWKLEVGKFPGWEKVPEW